MEWPALFAVAPFPKSPSQAHTLFLSPLAQVDVWALGITAVEMAERYPPRWKVNPNRVIFMIVKDPPPRLSDLDRWSLTFQDFIAQCLQKVQKDDEGRCVDVSCRRHSMLL